MALIFLGFFQTKHPPPPETAQELLVHGLGWKIAGELHSFSSPFASDCLEPKDPRYLIIAITAKS